MHERTSFSSQQRKRDRAYATTIIRAHEIIKNIRTYRYIIAEKKEYCFHVFERNFQTVRTFASHSAVKGRGAHLDNFLNRLDFYILHLLLFLHYQEIFLQIFFWETSC